MTNLTIQHQLVQELPLSGFLSAGKPVGREGFEVIVVERIGTGFRYYCSLQAGDTLSISERMFGRFSAYIVDMRPARNLDIDEKIVTANPRIFVSIKARILYAVTDAQKVALGIDDALGKFRDYIIGTLRRAIGQVSHQKITEAMCEQVIYNIGRVDHFGLAVEGVNLIAIEHDRKYIKELEDIASISHSNDLGLKLEEAEHQRQLRQHQRTQELEIQKATHDIKIRDITNEGDIAIQRRRIENLNMADLNTLLHLRPELTQEIFARITERERQEFIVRMEHDTTYRTRMLQVLDNYINNERDANPEDLIRLIRDVASQPLINNPRIVFNSPNPPPRITFGGVIDDNAKSPPASQEPDDDDQ